MLTLRVPPEVRDALDEVAADETRSRSQAALLMLVDALVARGAMKAEEAREALRRGGPRGEGRRGKRGGKS
ncbi:MAG: hypothetical protein P1V51_02825 [Deltaproteobacteria bacterium]|nr:hypothetical protein [Deltaproteobacteria bacterium]